MEEFRGYNKEYALKKGYLTIKTSEYTQLIDNKPFKKFYILDLRKLPVDAIKDVFENFNLIQDELVSNDFFYRTAQNLYLCFLCDDKEKFQTIAKEALTDLQYALKLLVTKEDLNLILDNNKDMLLGNQNQVLNISGNNISVKNFNLLYGGNGSGKTNLLNKIGRNFAKVPNSMISIPNKPEISLEDSGYLQAYIDSSEYMYNYFQYLMSIIKMAEYKSTPILIDDFGWNGLDLISQIKIVTLLNEASFKNQTYITASQEKIKHLVKNTVYDPNIIEL